VTRGNRAGESRLSVSLSDTPRAMSPGRARWFASWRTGIAGQIGRATRKTGHNLNRLFSAFVNTSATNRAYFRFRVGRGRIRLGRQQEFRMQRLVSRFLDDESGATAIEYAVIAAGISIVIVTVVNGIGTEVKVPFAAVSTALK
jgi:pilus assembly protein Flp/PilA